MRVLRIGLIPVLGLTALSAAFLWAAAVAVTVYSGDSPSFVLAVPAALFTITYLLGRHVTGRILRLLNEGKNGPSSQDPAGAANDSA